MIPGPWSALVLVLAVYRLARLVGWDDFPPIARLRDRVVGAHTVSRGSVNARMGVTRDKVETATAVRRPTLDKFLGCPFCAGFWIGLVVYGGWLAAGHPGAEPYRSPLLYVLAPLALNGAVGLVARNLDP